MAPENPVSARAAPPNLLAESAAEAGVDYPEYGAFPTHQLLTACEVLSWIGYRRAITLEQYFAPLNSFGALSGSAQDWEARIHSAIPEPKPNLSPIGTAEELLMKALRARSVRAFYIDKDTGLRAEVPQTDYESDVVVNVRGALEPSSTADMKRYEAAMAQPWRGKLWFSASEVLGAWPLPVEASGAASQEKRAPGPPILNQALLNSWLMLRHAERSAPKPTEELDWDAAKEHFQNPKLPRAMLRKARKKLPDESRKRGPRSNR